MSTYKTAYPMTIPGHELPGRIVFGIGCFLSAWSIVGLIVLKVG